MIDVNVHLSRWPFRRLPDDDPAALAARLRRNGVKQAWAGSFDGLLHKDIGAVNARLAEECGKHGQGLLVPFGSINPKLPDWQEDLRRCHESYRMPGIRLHPNYHGYTLADPVFAALMQLAAKRRLLVQIAVQMEDDRMQHPLMRVPPVDLAPLGDMPGVRAVLLNALRSASAPVPAKLAAAEGIYFDIASLDGIGGVERLAKQVSAKRVLFGSHAPFYILESAALKMKESALAPAEAARITEANARELLV